MTPAMLLFGFSSVVNADSPSRSPYQVFIQPRAGPSPIYRLLAGAHRSVELTAYELDDHKIVSLLAADAKRHVTVRVILDRAYHGMEVNQAAYHQLMADKVAVRFGPPDRIVHQKTLSIDGQRAAIMTGNLTAHFYATTRDVVIVDRRPADVAAVDQRFDALWDGRLPSGHSIPSDLLASPGAGGRFVALIEGARTRIEVETEELSSPAIVRALDAAARRGVAVEVVMSAGNLSAGVSRELVAAGVHVVITPPDSLYLHAKVMVVDDRWAFVGSENLSTTSLDADVELGIVTSDLAVVVPIDQMLAADARSGR